MVRFRELWINISLSETTRLGWEISEIYLVPSIDKFIADVISNLSSLSDKRL